MEKNQILKFTIPGLREFILPIHDFDPTVPFGPGWGFDEKIYGLADSDGITRFAELLEQAATVTRDEGYNMLFSTRLNRGQSIETLNDKTLADPDLIWSLLMEEGHAILNYLHDSYGVTYLEVLRRLLISREGYHCALCVYRDQADRKWRISCRWLGRLPGPEDPAILLS
jgi:hypothetical protein